MNLRQKKFQFLVPLLSIVLLLFILEVGFRINRYYSVKNARMNFLLVPKMFYAFDEELGYRYQGDTQFIAQWMGDDGNLRRTNQVKINRFGQVSTREVSLVKPKGEFRIATVGDSLTACIHNDRPWSDTLEELLNADTKLKAALNANSIKVMNLGLDGIGVEQMQKIASTEAKRFNADLVMVHFITADIYRRHSWRRPVRFELEGIPYEVVLNCASLPAQMTNSNCAYADILAMDPKLSSNPMNLQKVREKIASDFSKSIDWFTPYPQFLSWALKGRLELVMGRNPYTPLSTTIESRDESKRVTERALRKIKEEFPTALLLHMPVYWELVYNAVPALANEVIQMAPELGITPMISYFPVVHSEEHANTWINHPWDMHWNNVGARIYAQAVHAHLREVYLNKETTQLQDSLNPLSMSLKVN